MRFKTSVIKDNTVNSPVTCIGWSNGEEVYSAGDDNKLLSWSVSTHESVKVTEFNSELFPIDMHFLPRLSGSLSKHGDLLLLTSADGRFHVMNRTGRIERTVESHKGAVLVGQWSNDGAGILTAGEDGFVKIWSRGGMLRSTVVSSDNSVYSACWSPDSQSIAYTQGKFVIIKQLAPNTKPLKWRGHEGVVLCLAWSLASELIISGGEDCRYKVWDSQGRQLYSSGLDDYPITALSWSPHGDLFAVGSYNTLRLCDFTGWSRSLDKPNTGGIYKLAWSNDGTQVAGACANGSVIFAHVIERQVSYMNFIATVAERKSITVQNVSNETTEILDVPERVIQIALKYSHLVVTTPTQCYVYNTNNWNTPTIFELRDGSVILLSLAERHMLLVERSTIGVYNYQGRLISSPRWPNMRLENLRSSHISLSPDTLVVRDSSDFKIVYIMDLGSNRSLTDSAVTVQHTIPILQVALDQLGASTSRTLALLDKNRDLYIVPVRSTYKTFMKLGGQIQSFQWNTEDNIIAAIQDTRLVVWYCPKACYNATLLRLSSLQYDSSELGRSPRIHNFVGTSVSIRRADGSLVNIPISPFPTLLHRHIQDNKWNEALSLCRSTDDKILWTCLAVLATQSSSDLLDIAEEAFAAINHYDKVIYIQHIKGLPIKAQQMAGAALLGGSIQNAESILLHNGLVYNAILTHIQLHNWNRALDIATKHKVHVDTVLYMRQKYLDTLGKQENSNVFLNLRDSVAIDEEKIKQRIESETTASNKSV